MKGGTASHSTFDIEDGLAMTREVSARALQTRSRPIVPSRRSGDELDILANCHHIELDLRLRRTLSLKDSLGSGADDEGACSWAAVC
jgi:hypothetical protein